MTNAARATPATAQPRHVALYIAADHNRLTLLVWDASPQPPARRAHEQDSAGGRGLEIVDALTDRWGTWAPVSNGKVVWAWFNLHRT